MKCPLDCYIHITRLFTHTDTHTVLTYSGFVDQAERCMYHVPIPNDVFCNCGSDCLTKCSLIPQPYGGNICHSLCTGTYVQYVCVYNFSVYTAVHCNVYLCAYVDVSAKCGK